MIHQSTDVENLTVTRSRNANGDDILITVVLGGACTQFCFVDIYLFDRGSELLQVNVQIICWHNHKAPRRRPYSSESAYSYTRAVARC
jgi:uncharacterized protein YdeI (BOF family)